jgi:hypothetical protein
MRPCRARFVVRRMHGELSRPCFRPKVERVRRKGTTPREAEAKLIDPFVPTLRTPDIQQNIGSAAHKVPSTYALRTMQVTVENRVLAYISRKL